MADRSSDPPSVGQPGPASLFHGLTFKVASGPERAQALEIRREVYARDWPGVPMAKVIDAADETAHHLVACTGEGEVIASLRIIASGQRPFDMDRYVFVDPLLPSGRVPAEIGRLCVKHGRRHIKSNSFVQLGIFELGINLSLQLGATDLLLTALPTLRNIYRLAGFTDAGATFHHPIWGYVHVMRLDLLGLSGDGMRTKSARRILRSIKSRS